MKAGRPTGIRPFGRRNVPAPTGSEAAAFDRISIDERAVPHFTLMENAGRSAALVLHRLFPKGPVMALVGSGNNGGDALVVLRNLAAWGREVRGVLVADRAGPEIVLHDWPVPLIRDVDLGDDPGAWDRVLAGAGVLVDGILGTGIQGAPRDRQARAIEAANRSGLPILALDIPSGADADSGATPGPVIRAQITVALGFPKLGSLLHPARESTGRLVTVEIGFPEPDPHAFSARVITPAWFSGARPRRSLVTHKNAVGSLLVLAGKPGMAGAAVLAARAGIRSGAGYVRVASAPENREILQEAVPDAVFVDRTDEESLKGAVETADAVLVGPGMGTDPQAGSLLESMRGWVERRPVIADADALTLMAEGKGAGTLAGWAARGPLVVTPHLGEMARLTGSSPDALGEDRLGVVRDFSGAHRAVTLLKGTPSLVAEPGGRLWVDSLGNSDLATAGMGDVLAGAVGSFLAQGADPWDAAALGLHVTGRAAVRADRGPGLSSADVAEQIPDALREEGPGATDLDFPFVTFDQDPPR